MFFRTVLARGALAGAAALWLAGGAALAQTTGGPPTGGPPCPRPATPACIDDLTTYVSADRMIACQSAVKEHIESTMTYLLCRPGGDDAANDELNAAVRRFNCRLAGGEDCR